jgi:hypothetical protein
LIIWDCLFSLVCYATGYGLLILCLILVWFLFWFLILLFSDWTMDTTVGLYHVFLLLALFLVLVWIAILFWHLSTYSWAFFKIFSFDLPQHKVQDKFLDLNLDSKLIWILNPTFGSVKILYVFLFVQVKKIKSSRI